MLLIRQWVIEKSFHRFIEQRFEYTLLNNEPELLKTIKQAVFKTAIQHTASSLRPQQP